MRITEVPESVACSPGTNQRNVADATYGTYVDWSRRLLEFVGEDAPIESIDRTGMAEFEVWLRERRTEKTGQPVSPVTLNGFYRRTRAIWNRLEQRGVTVCDISGLFAQVPTGAVAARAATESEIRKLIARCNLRDAAMILLAARSGIRRQSIPRILLSNVKIWHNPAGQSRFAASIPKEKTSAPRVIFASHDAAVTVAAYLATRQHQSEWLFCRMDSPAPLSTGYLTNIWRRAVRRADFPESAAGNAWHSLRHFFAQSKLDDGHDARIVAEWMGITVETLLQVYANPRLERLASAAFGEDVPADVLNSFGRR